MSFNFAKCSYYSDQVKISSSTFSSRADLCRSPNFSKTIKTHYFYLESAYRDGTHGALGAQ